MTYMFLSYVADQGKDGMWGIIDKEGAILYEYDFDNEDEARFIANYHNENPEAEYERDVLPAWEAYSNKSTIKPHPRVLTQATLLELMEKRGKAMTEVVNLCSGARKFTMSIPVQPTDSDEMIIDALMAMERMWQEVERIRGEIKVMLVENYDMPEAYRQRLETIIFNG